MSEEQKKHARSSPGGEARKRPSSEAWTDRLYSLFMQAPAMIAVLKGPDHRFEIANPRYMELIARDRDIIGQPVRKIFPDLVNQGFFELLDAAYESGQPRVGYEHPVKVTRKDGRTEEIFVNFVYQPTRDASGAVDGIFAHAVDVTQNIHARRQVEESEEKYRRLFNSVDQGFCIVQIIRDDSGRSVDYRFLETNPVFERQTGLTKAVGKTARELVPDLEGHWPEIYGRVAASGQPQKFVEGSEAMGRWFEVYAFPVGRDTNKVALLFTDITEQKDREAVRSKLMAELEQRVTERTEALHHVNEELQRSNEDLLQFAHVASHDLKEPIRKIQTFLDLLPRDGDTRLSDRAGVYLNKIQNASQRMISMIEGVLHYSALDSHGQPKELIHLPDILRDIESDLEVLISEKRARLVYDKAMPLFEGAPLLVFQLLYNLLNNALKFSKKDVDPVVRVHAEKVIQSNEDHIQIRIADNGIGFDQKYAERIFITFLRLHSKDQFDGTGLGLSLCRKIVERHRGTIRAEGLPNEGATFVIELPLIQSRAVI